MRFDDRLKTVLDAPVADDRDRAVRWRQLVDILSRARPDADPVLMARAVQAARDDRASVPDDVRAATARSIAGRPLDSRLIALFASDRLEVAAPVLAGASLDAATRAEVAASASDDVRRFFFALEGRAVPPAPPAPTEPVPSGNEVAAIIEAAEEQLSADAPIPSIGEVVARIEKLRERRKAEPGAGEQGEDPAEPLELDQPIAPPVAPDIALFRWESDAQGALAWVEGAPRAALIGRALAGHPGEALLGEPCRELVSRRAPFADIPLAAGEPFGGEWRVSGAPAFAPGDGRFIGYRGIARRLDLTPAQRAAAPRAFEGADSLREMIHEIKTPLNAIIGFAEIIDGQYLGPAHRRYRDRAAEILGQARELLTAIEDLDFAAKLQSGRHSPGEGTDFKDIFPRLAEAMNDYGAPRGIGVVYRLQGRFTRCALAPELAERLVRRFLQGIVDAADDRESLSVEVAPLSGMCGVSVLRPSTLRDIRAEQLFDPAYPGPSGGTRIGLGFTFRLVRGLVRIAGGDLQVDAERFMLRMPAGRH